MQFWEYPQFPNFFLVEAISVSRLILGLFFGHLIISCITPESSCFLSPRSSTASPMKDGPAFLLRPLLLHPLLLRPLLLHPLLLHPILHPYPLLHLQRLHSHLLHCHSNHFLVWLSSFFSEVLVASQSIKICSGKFLKAKMF